MVPICHYRAVKGAAMETRTNTEKMQLRLPADLKLWLAKQAKRNGSSQNSEIVRALRERAERMTTGKAA